MKTIRDLDYHRMQDSEDKRIRRMCACRFLRVFFLLALLAVAVAILFFALV